MPQLLKGSAFITGAASGIGQACAVAFAQNGVAKLALADVNFEALKASNAEIRKSFPEVEILDLHMDVRKTADVERGIQETVERFGRLDIALNNAGVGGSGKQTHETDEEEWDRIIDINLNGVRRCQKEEIAVMLKQENLGPREGQGRIINVSSMYGIVGPAGMHHTAYSTAKHGILGLTKADANSYSGEYAIRINAICPGYVDTPLVKMVMDMGSDSPLAHDIAKTPLKRTATMEEIADSVVFLASPMSSFMQGAALIADGGFTTN